jgi:hypothetical protein
MHKIAKKRIAKLMKHLTDAFSEDGFIYTAGHNSITPNAFMKENIVSEKVWIDGLPFLKWGK